MALSPERERATFAVAHAWEATEAIMDNLVNKGRCASGRSQECAWRVPAVIMYVITVCYMHICVCKCIHQQTHAVDIHVHLCDIICY